MCDEESEEEFVNRIAPDVLGVLEKRHFFEFLDELFCPTDPTRLPVKCAHSFDQTKTILRNLDMDSDDIDDVLAVLHSRGACCDCEVLYNVVEESGLKARYWKARTAELLAEKDQLLNRNSTP
jgi:hypothetical protein